MPPVQIVSDPISGVRVIDNLLPGTTQRTLNGNGDGKGSAGDRGRFPVVPLGSREGFVDPIERVLVREDPVPRPSFAVAHEEIERARGLVQGRANIAQEVKARSERVKQIARYRTPADTSPMTDSLAFPEGDVIDTEATGVGANRLPNVLGEDTWDLFRILLR